MIYICGPHITGPEISLHRTKIIQHTTLVLKSDNQKSGEVRQNQPIWDLNQRDFLTLTYDCNDLFLTLEFCELDLTKDNSELKIASVVSEPDIFSVYPPIQAFETSKVSLGHSPNYYLVVREAQEFWKA